MRLFTVTLLFYFSVVFSLCAQHTITIEPGDTIYLDIDTWRGELQWQLSDDNETWTDLQGRTSDTIKYVPQEFPSYFRVQIIDGNCAPHYTETVEVTAAEEVPVLPTIATLAPQNIGTSTGETGGNIMDTGGASITAWGVVYSTSPGPDLDNGLYTTEETGSDSFLTLLTDLAPNTTYYVRAYATNSEGTAYGEEYGFTTLQEVTYFIGDQGPAGGIIFYDKGSYSDGWRYLEAAPASWSGGPDPWVDVEWGCNGTLVDGTSTDVGTGRENTIRIVANGCAENNTPVHIAWEADIGGYTDWFLPSRDELNALYNNLIDLGGTNFHSKFGFSLLTYTSSSESNSTGAWGYDFAGGGNVLHSKTIATIAVRPIRRF